MNLPLILVVILGIITSYEDHYYHKIKNYTISFFSLITASMLYFYGRLNLSMLLILAACFLGSFFLYLLNFWRGGDAKLFTLYNAILLIHTQYTSFVTPLQLLAAMIIPAYTYLVIKSMCHIQYRKLHYPLPENAITIFFGVIGISGLSYNIPIPFYLSLLLIILLLFTISYINKTIMLIINAGLFVYTLLFIPITQSFLLLTILLILLGYLTNIIILNTHNTKMRFAPWMMVGALLTLSLPLISNQETPLISNQGTIDEQINAGIQFLATHQQEDGSFRNNICYDPYLIFCFEDYAIFPTAIILESLSQLPVQSDIIQKGVAYLVLHKEEDGLWKYWTKKSKHYYKVPPDADDTIASARILKKYNYTLINITEILFNYTDNEGRFYTWFNHQGNDIDCVVNANVFNYLKTSTPNLCTYLSSSITNKSCSHYYLTPLSLYDSLSRVSEIESSCLDNLKEKIINNILQTQKKDCSFGNDLDTAIALGSLIRLNYTGPQIDCAASLLRKKQKPDGSWNKHVWYGYSLYYYGSKEITTAFAIEALYLYQHTYLNSFR
ncbi:MAG: hypothetical protein AABX52_03615 [Nanoarchaeota archaeon]